MDDATLDTIYKSAISVSHFAGLRTVYDAGYYEGAALTPTASSVDQSVVKSAPVADVSISMV